MTPTYPTITHTEGMSSKIGWRTGSLSLAGCAVAQNEPTTPITWKADLVGEGEAPAEPTFLRRFAGNLALTRNPHGTMYTLMYE